MNKGMRTHEESFRFLKSVINEHLIYLNPSSGNFDGVSEFQFQFLSELIQYYSNHKLSVGDLKEMWKMDFDEILIDMLDAIAPLFGCWNWGYYREYGDDPSLGFRLYAWSSWEEYWNDPYKHEPFGKELAQAVADRLRSGTALRYNHSDNCGTGLIFHHNVFFYANFENGYQHTVIEQFQDEESFVNWLSLQSTESLSGHDGHFLDKYNQRITKVRLTKFVSDQGN